MTNLRDYAQLIRLPAMFTVCSNIIAAYCLATGYWAGTEGFYASFQLYPFLFALLASLCFYHGGMVLNDCFDFEIDCRERPLRPLPAGKISTAQAWCLGWGLLGLGLVLAAFIGLHTVWIASALALAIISYNRGSRRGWIAALNMGLCRYLNWIMAMSAVGLSWQLALVPIPVLFYIIALTRISQEEAEAGDRAVLIGAGAIILAAAVIWITAFITGFFIELWVMAALLIGLIILGHRLIRIYQHFEPSDVQATVGLLVLGVIPLDALLLASTGQVIIALLLMLLLLPGKWLGRFLYVS